MPQFEENNKLKFKNKHVKYTRYKLLYIIKKATKM